MASVLNIIGLIGLIFVFVFQFNPYCGQTQSLQEFAHKNGIKLEEYSHIYPLEYKHNEVKIKQDMSDTHFYLQHEAHAAFDRFISYKKVMGTISERKYYQQKSANDLIQKCIANTAIIFYDMGITLLRDVDYVIALPWEQIGKDKYERANDTQKQEIISQHIQKIKQVRKLLVEKWKMEEKFEANPEPIITYFNINNYLSYDEMHLCSLIIIAGPSSFGNDCARNNKGIRVGEETRGYIVGAVGPLIDRIEKMHSPNKGLLKIIYKATAYEDDQIMMEIIETRIYKMIFESYFYFVKSTINKINTHEHPAKKAYISVMGIGTGEHAGSLRKKEQLQTLIVNVVKNIAKESSQHIHTIDFTFFDSITNVSESDWYGIKIKFSENNPASEKDCKCIKFMLYSRDSNAFVGNYFWMKGASNNPQLGQTPPQSRWLTISSNSAAACCSTIIYSQNVQVNTNLSQRHIIKILYPNKVEDISLQSIARRRLMQSDGMDTHHVFYMVGFTLLCSLLMTLFIFYS